MSDNYTTLLWAHLADIGEDCICWVRFDLLQPLLRVVPRGPKSSPMPITTQSTTERNTPVLWKCQTNYCRTEFYLNY